MQKKSNTSSSVLDVEGRTEVRRELMASSRGTKKTVATVLTTLQERGLLNDDVLGASKHESRALSKAVATHANANTPYGTVVQAIEIEHVDDGPIRWMIIHPFAFIWYLSSICDDFAQVMMSSTQSAVNRCLDLILYGDELTPGNPMRSDGGRQAFNFYYGFVNWPRWLLHRKDGWLCFGSLQTRVIDGIVGGVGALMRTILRVFFVDGTSNCSVGFMFVHKGETEYCKAKFKGFIADEKGLKEFCDLKGASGTKCCVSCKNVVNFVHKQSAAMRQHECYKVGLDVLDLKDCKLADDKFTFAMADRLKHEDSANNIPEKEFEQLEKDFGMNFNPHGIWQCPDLRPHLAPVSNYFRDWQHTLMSSGVAGTEVGGCLTVMMKDPACKRHGVSLETIETYCDQFKLPTCWGKVNSNWFRAKFITPDHVKHFASDVMCMVVLLASFMETMLKPLGCLPEHTESMCLLRDIITVLRLTYDVDESVHKTLSGLVSKHHKLFHKLYHKLIKVKFHQLLHLPDDLLRLGVCLSCFCLERKHRDWKRLSLYIFRTCESTTTIDFVNYSIQEMVSGRFKFKEFYLDDPETVCVDGNVFDVARAAFLRAGEVKCRDVVLCETTEATYVGEIIRFYGSGDEDDTVTAEVLVYEPITGSHGDFSTERTRTAFIEGSAIRTACAWGHRRKGVIHVLTPRLDLL